MTEEHYEKEIGRLRTALEEADAVVIGAGAGLSTSAGFTYAGERFRAHFSDFAAKYDFSDMYSGGFYPYETLEEAAGTGAGQGLFCADNECTSLFPEGRI